MSVKAGTRVTSKGTLEFQIFKQQKQVQPEAIAAGAAGQGHSSDELPLPCTFTNGTWRSLTGASVRQTQKQICDLLRMDFETFVNSAYLRQGKADEFTTRPPSERKQILSEILGLSYFDRLQEKAKERARQLKVEAEICGQRPEQFARHRGSLEVINRKIRDSPS